MKYSIRTAKIEDMPKVLERIQELAVFENEPDAVEVTVEDLEKEGFGDTPLFYCYVAESNFDIIGIALFYYRFSTWKGRSIHLEDLIVKEDKRGLGIGSALYEKVMQFAVEKKVKRVEWNVLDWNTPAVNFYKKTGAKILDDWKVVQMDHKGLMAFTKVTE